MSTVSATSNIRSVVVDGDLHIDEEGKFTAPKGSFSQSNGILKIETTDDGDTIFNISQGNIIGAGNIRIGGGSYFNSISCTNGAMTFNAPASTVLVINGRRITVGDIERLASGQTIGATDRGSTTPTTETYCLDPNSRIERIDVKGNGKVYIPDRFLSKHSLFIEMSGNSCVKLPHSETDTNSFTAVISGNSKIECADGAHFVTCCTITSSGNSRLSGLKVLRNGTITASGNSRVNVAAYNHKQISRSSSGNARVEIEKINGPPPTTAVQSIKREKRERSSDDAEIQQSKKSKANN